MAEIRVIHSLAGPFAAEEPVEELLIFLRANGYVVVELERGGAADEPLASVWHARLTRGEEGAGWWSSEMTRLATTLTIDSTADAIRFDYRVDVRGQRMTREECDYWAREVRSAGRYLADEGELVDLRQIEADRARNARHGRLRYGFCLAAVLFVVLFILQLLFVY